MITWFECRFSFSFSSAGTCEFSERSAVPVFDLLTTSHHFGMKADENQCKRIGSIAMSERAEYTGEGL